LLSLPRSILVLFGCGAVLLAAGCGGSGGGSSSHNLSAPEFRNRANHICLQLRNQAKATAGSNSKADVQRNFARIDAAVARLASLNPPAQYELRYKALLENFRQTVDFVRTNREQLIALGNRLSTHPSDKQTLHRYQQLTRPFEQKLHVAVLEATELGLPDCANGFSGGATG
jgi:hypothetical protein